MEQYLLQVPKKLAMEVRKSITNRDANKIELVSSADNKHFSFLINNKEYPTKIVQLPCILETHKTYDDNLFYKSGEIGQAFVVTESEDDKQLLEEVEEVPNGITPPNTNVVKRKYEKTKRYTPFPKPDVARVEEDLVKIIAGNGPVEDIQEELVDFYDWMVDASNPNKGIVVTDEIELIRQHPEYLMLTKDEPKEDEEEGPPTKQTAGKDHHTTKSGNIGVLQSSTKTSTVNTPQVTDTDAESPTGALSAQRSPLENPSPSPNMSAEEKEVDDLEEELLGDMEPTASSATGSAMSSLSTTTTTTTAARAARRTPPMGSSRIPLDASVVASPLDALTPAASPPPLKAREDDPEYQKLVAIKAQLEKKMVEFDREVYDLRVKVETSSNIIVKNRFKQQLENAETQRTSIAKEMEQTKEQIAQFTVQ